MRQQRTKQKGDREGKRVLPSMSLIAERDLFIPDGITSSSSAAAAGSHSKTGTETGRPSQARDRDPCQDYLDARRRRRGCAWMRVGSANGGAERLDSILLATRRLYQSLPLRLTSLSSPSRLLVSIPDSPSCPPYRDSIYHGSRMCMERLSADD